MKEKKIKVLEYFPYIPFLYDKCSSSYLFFPFSLCSFHMIFSTVEY